MFFSTGLAKLTSVPAGGAVAASAAGGGAAVAAAATPAAAGEFNSPSPTLDDHNLTKMLNSCISLHASVYIVIYATLDTYINV